MDEPGFSEEYAKMCKVLNEKQVKENGQVVNFRKLLITRCQVEFEKDYMEGLDKNTYKQQLALADTEEKKKELQEDFEFKERKARRRSAEWGSGHQQLSGTNENKKLKMSLIMMGLPII